MVKTHPFLAGELYEPLQFLTLFVRKLHDLVDQSYPMVNPFSIIFPSLLLEQVLTFGKKNSNLTPWHHRGLLLRHPRGLFGHRHSRLGWEHGGSCCWDFPWMVGKSPRTRQSMVLTLFKHGLDMFKHGLDKFKLKVFRFLMLPPFQSHTNIKYLPPDLLGVGLQPGLTTADRHWDEIIGMIPRLLG
jgi:hypothetical protein